MIVGVPKEINGGCLIPRHPRSDLFFRPIGYALVAWWNLLFLYGLNAGPLYRTESLRAIIGAECVRGHWLYPVLYGEPFLTKPPGHYAAIGLCSLPFGGVTDWSARLPSVIAATVAVVLMVGLFRRTLGDRAALVAGFLLPTSVLWLDKVPSAEIDMTLVGWVTASLVLFHRAIETPGPPSLGFLTTSLLCVAAGTLTKWTAPAFFALTAVPLLAWQGRLRLLVGWRFLLAVGLAVAVVTGWALAVAGQVGWDALADTVRKEAAYRFAPKSATKGYPWVEVVTYPLLVLAAHLPLSLFALRTLRPSFLQSCDDRTRRVVQFLHCWTWPNLLFWALVPNHNVRYALPLSPGLMGLGVVGLLQYYGSLPLSRDAERSAKASVLRSASRLNNFLVVFLALWLAAKVVFVEVVVPRRTANRNAEATAAELRGLVPPGEILYLSKLKDEGVLFYYGRPARKRPDAADMPRPCYAALIQSEWDARGAGGGVELVRRLYDQQGDPLILVHVR